MRSISAGEDRRVALLREFERSGLPVAGSRREALQDRGVHWEEKVVHRGKPPPEGYSTGEPDYTIIYLIVPLGTKA